MKVIVAGGRDYKPDGAAYRWLREKLRELGADTIISGGATGADAMGEANAKTDGYRLMRFPADWKTHGRAAGPIRNREMAKHADAVILFPGGRGTDSMRREAEANGLVVIRYGP